MRKHQVYDPNSHLDRETIERGLTEARKALAITDRPWQPTTHHSSISLLSLYQVWDWHLIYVRVTTDEVTFAGPGERPRVLGELARELHAHFQAVVRVHLGADGSVQLIGFQNLIAKLLYMAKEWNRRMLDGKTAREHLALAGGEPAILTVTHIYDPHWHKPKTDEELITGYKAQYRQPRTELSDILAEIPSDILEGETEADYVQRRFTEFRAEPERPAHGHLVLKLAAAGLPETELSVNIGALAKSTTWNEDYEILTCSCGSGGCAGIGRGISVTHESGLTVWWMHFARPRRFLVFDQQQYRTEIFSKIRAALQFHADLPQEVRFGDIGFNEGREEQRQWAEAALAEAEAFHQSELSITPLQQSYAQPT